MRMLIGPALSWLSQVRQYPLDGPSGISYFAGFLEGNPVPVDCLLWRDSAGSVRGILNHYAIDYPPLEEAGNIFVLVDPQWQRRGIATALVDRAQELWGPISTDQQKYSEAGLAFMTKYRATHHARD